METRLELLAPAKNVDQGIAAINHGADAVYIGAPMFGARVAAGNTVQDIERLVNHAHLYGSKTFATVNTLLFDNELEQARKLIWSLYNIGIDAIIVQDMGILELDIPPIELHASTQTHNLDPLRIEFLEQAGFKRIILAREMSLEQMKVLRKETTADLEAFVQGALCVCYSGQCYMSHYLTGRSGNRGACTQPCRSAYNLVNKQGKRLIKDQHLLSLKDFSAAQHIESMIDAGITSFKIEGRLKDISYVKNVTAYYRKLLDSIIERRAGFCAASSGKTKVFFEPDLERTFNRGFTDYFLVKRQSMASLSTQKSLGKRIGKIVSANGNKLTIKSTEPVVTGDGLCYLNNDGSLDGFLVNNVDGDRITANKKLSIQPGITLWRNNDYAFEKKMQGPTSERKINVSMTVEENNTGLQLSLVDEDGCTSVSSIECEKIPARDAERASEIMTSQLTKLGNTPFAPTNIRLSIASPLFLPASTINELRREAVEKLSAERLAHFRPKDTPFIPNEIPYYKTEIDGSANVVNKKAEEFYRRHKVSKIEKGPDYPENRLTTTPETSKIPLMTTKYCLRYELGQCLLHKNNRIVDPDFSGDLFLENNGNLFELSFDCKRCEMCIIKPQC